MSTNTSEVVITIVGYVLFAISEILPLINIPTNGILQSLVIGVGKAFKNPEKDIEMANMLIKNKPEFVNIVNSISTNPQILQIVNSLISNPFDANNVTIIQNNPDISNVVSMIGNNNQLRNTVVGLASDPNLYNNINMLLNNPKTASNMLALHTNTKLEQALPVLIANNNLLDAFKIPDLMLVAFNKFKPDPLPVIIPVKAIPPTTSNSTLGTLLPIPTLLSQVIIIFNVP